MRSGAKLAEQSNATGKAKKKKSTRNETLTGWALSCERYYFIDGGKTYIMVFRFHFVYTEKHPENLRQFSRVPDYHIPITWGT